MTSLEYLYKLFETSARQLGLDYVKTTPTNLQTWATDKEPPFVALLGLSEAIEINSLQNNILSYDCTFVFCGTSNPTPTIEEKIQLEVEVDKILKRFLWFVKRNETVIELTSINAEELFRGFSFHGVGRGLTFTISLPDLNDYCDDFCNESTKELECE